MSPLPNPAAARSPDAAHPDPPQPVPARLPTPNPNRQAMQDPVLEGTLRKIRAERSKTRNRRNAMTATATALALSAAVLYGHHRGQESAPTPVHLAATDNNVHLNAKITPAPGWIRIEVTVTGLPPAQPCLLLLTDRAGQTYQAGGWVATDSHTTLTGAASLTHTDLATITITTRSGHPLLTAHL
ncbi:hypothetical protein GCM10010492_73870 [Saccharothrix mutabilis subsp. mutabilis]|uniref:Anti-sigma factor n=2 Tax=Saccharothrix mutabilis TaxID=33921 RepID=A0ABN0UUR6_9PSEU